MHGNSNILGPLQRPSKTKANGVFDTFDQFNSGLVNAWPVYKRALTCTFSENTNFYVGGSYNFGFTTQGISDGTTIYYEFVGVGLSNGNFYDNASVGSFTVYNNSGSVYKQFDFDSEITIITFIINIRIGTSSGTIIGTFGNFYLQPASFTLSSISSVNEGNKAVYNVTATNYGTNTLYWATTAPGSDVNASSGSINLSNGSGSFSIDILDDYLTEGTENYTVFLRTFNSGGKTLASQTFSINDTSITPTANVSPNVTSVNEGATVTVNVTTTNFTSGTLYWYTESVSNFGSDDTTPSSGSVSISGSSGSFDVTITADGYTEGTQQFRVVVKLADERVIGTSSTITINDTSTGTQEPTGEDLYNSFYSIAEFQNNDGASDTSSNYSVSEVQSAYSGTGQLYLIHKATGATSYFNDVPIACIQILNSSGTSIIDQYWFGTSGDGQGWYTCTVEYALGPIGTGVNITPAQAASNYTYTTAVVNGTTADRFCLTSSTGSSSTGAVDGIALPTGPMTLGEKTVPQSSGTYYMYRETSGAQVSYCSLCRGPVRTWSAGEKIRIAYIIGNYSTANYYTPTDTLFVGIQ